MWEGSLAVLVGEKVISLSCAVNAGISTWDDLSQLNRSMLESRKGNAPPATATAKMVLRAIGAALRSGAPGAPTFSLIEE